MQKIRELAARYQFPAGWAGGSLTTIGIVNALNAGSMPMAFAYSAAGLSFVVVMRLLVKD